MNPYCYLLLLLSLLMTTGCATMTVNLMGRRTIYDGPRAASVSTNGDIVIKDVRYERSHIRTSHPEDYNATQRYYCVRQSDILAMTNKLTTVTNVVYEARTKAISVTRHLQVDYHQFPIEPSSPSARFIDAALLSNTSKRQHFTYGGDEVWVLAEGRGGFHPLKYPLLNSTIDLEMGPTHGHESGEYKRTWAKVLFPVLIVPAVALDIVVFPVTIVFISTMKIMN